MLRTLEERCKNDEDRKTVEIIRQLHQDQKVINGDEQFDSGKGVAQEIVLSPVLFNIVLDAAHSSVPILKNLILSGDLSAYADNILIQASNSSEIRTIMRQLANL